MLDIALSHALLREVAAGRRAAFAAPVPARADRRLRAARRAAARVRPAARRHRHGHVPVVRPAGGHAAVYGPGCLIVEHLTREEDVTAGLEARFAAQSALMRRRAARSSAPTRGSASSRASTAPGRTASTSAAGSRSRGSRSGRSATARSPPRSSWCGGGAGAAGADRRALRRARAGVTDIATAGALDEALPGVTPERVADAIRARSGDPREVELDRRCSPRRAPWRRATSPRRRTPGAPSGVGARRAAQRSAGGADRARRPVEEARHRDRSSRPSSSWSQRHSDAADPASAARSSAPASSSRACTTRGGDGVGQQRAAVVVERAGDVAGAEPPLDLEEVRPHRGLQPVRARADAARPAAGAAARAPRAS